MEGKETSSFLSINLSGQSVEASLWVQIVHEYAAELNKEGFLDWGTHWLQYVGYLRSGRNANTITLGLIVNGLVDPEEY